MTCARRWAHAAALAAVVVGVSLLTGGRAAAHAELVQSSPGADSVLPESPAQIVLTFGEPVNTVRDSVRLVVASDGTEIDLDPAGQDGGSDTIIVDVPELADGSYVVAWRAVSADSHPVSGAFVFAVGSVSSTQPGLVGDLLSQSEPPTSGEAWLGIGRAVSFAGLALLVGGLACTLRCAPSRLASRSTGVLLWIGAAAGVGGTATMIAAQASITVDDWLAWDEVGDTTAGRWWVVRLGFFIAVMPLLLRRRADRWGGWWVNVCLLGGAGLVAVVAAGGHGVSGRLVPLGYTVTIVHLVAMSLWAGGLVVVALSARDDVWLVASRFSPVALLAVATLAVTGAVNAWRQSDSFDGLRHSTYGRWLLVKLVVVTAVVVIAALNRRRLSTVDPSARHMSQRTLRRLVVAEVAGVALVFTMTAGLVNAAPPRAEAAPSIESVSVVQDGRVAQLTLDPAVTGGTVMHLYITSTTGSLDQPTDITVSATLPAQGIGPLEVSTVAAGPGHVQSTDADLPLPGRWTFTVTARFGEFDATVFVLQMRVSS